MKTLFNILLLTLVCQSKASPILTDTLANCSLFIFHQLFEIIKIIRFQKVLTMKFKVFGIFMKVLEVKKKLSIVITSV
jgi:hypothetical protein